MGVLARARRWGIPGLIGTAALLAALAATAFAFVNVYSNGFNSRHAFREIKGADAGKRCDRAWSSKRKQMKVKLKNGPNVCTYKPPVQGDAPRPDHRLLAKGKILKATNKAVRAEAYLTISVRVGGGGRYELRVFPKSQEYILRRQPGGGAFPATGTNADIGEIGEKNKLQLVAEGNEVRAKVNGTDLATVTDGNASELEGTRLEFGIGSDADSGRDTIGNFSKLVVSVPNP